MNVKIMMYTHLNYQRFRVFNQIVDFLIIQDIYYRVSYVISVYPPNTSMNNSPIAPGVSVTVYIDEHKPLMQNCFTLDSEIFEPFCMAILAKIADFLHTDIKMLKLKRQ